MLPPTSMPNLDIEQVDLAELVEVLRSTGVPLIGELTGRSQMRDVIAEHLECSMLEAEELVDTLISLGFARLLRDPEGLEGWRLSPEA